jgi:CHAT domain-containing protein
MPRTFYLGAALVLAVSGAVWLLPPGSSAQIRRLRGELVAASTSRHQTARLDGGYAYAALAQPVRGAAVVTASPELKMAAARIEALARDTLTPEALALAGEARLQLGQYTEAISYLDLAARSRPDLRTLTNLAAAYVSRVEIGGEPEDMVTALDVASRAVAERSASPEAWFNKALACEQAALRDAAREAWQQYLRRDPSGPWADEARQHLARLPDDAVADPQARALLAFTVTPSAQAADVLAREAAQPVREWLEGTGASTWADAVLHANVEAARTRAAVLLTLSEALARRTGDALPLLAARELPRAARSLAQGHAAYGRGLTLSLESDRDGAFASFQESLHAFERAGSVQQHWASLQIAVIEYRRRNLDESDRRLAVLAGVARDRRWHILGARVGWMQGQILFQRGQFAEALVAYGRAIQTYEAAGEIENAGHVSNASADTLRFLGDRRTGWEHLRRALSHAPAFREPFRRYLVFFNASLYAARDRLRFASLEFQNAAVAEARRDTRSPGLLVEARLRRAAVLGRLRRYDEAAADLAAARPMMPALPDRRQADYFAATASMVEGELFPDRPASLEALDSALAFFRRVEPAEIPRLLLARAVAEQAQGQAAGAERSIAAGIDAFVQRRRLLKADDDRIAYLGEGVDLFGELARVRLALKQSDLAVFDALEQGRARTLFEDIAGTDAPIRPLAELYPSIPSGVSVIAFSVMPDRLLIWIVDRNGVQFRPQAITAERLAMAVELLEAALALHAPDRKLHETAAALARLVVDPWRSLVPAGNSVVLIPDGPLHRTPFPLLPSGPARPLIAAHALSVSPSVNLYVTALTRHSDSGTPPLLVGNPAAASEPTLRPLTEAENEVRAIERMYQGASVLVGPQATRPAVVDALVRTSMFHFAGHAIADPASPRRSRLVLAGDAMTGSLTSADIAVLKLANLRLVVLAACQTARGPVRAGEGVMSLARPFLAAGAGTVVGSLWDLNDGAARAAFTALHREMRGGRPVAESLRAVQLWMMQSDDPVLRDPASWAGLVVVGTGIDENRTTRQEVR